MKNILLATATTSLLLNFPLAQAADNHGHHGHAAQATAMSAEQGAMAEGMIKKVDHKKSRLTIAHGPLASLGMPPMTMAFKVGKESMLDQVKVGDKVRFVAEDISGVYTVTAIELSK